MNVEDPGAVIDSFVAARQDGEAMLTIEEKDGAEVIVVVDAVVYFAGEPPAKGGVGFAAAEATG